MVTPAYIGRQFAAILAMLRGRPWQALLDQTSDGVFRSFWALPLSLPLAVLTHMLTVPVLELSPTYDELGLPDLPLAYSATVQILKLVGSWALVMFLLVGLCQQIKAGNRVTPLIVSYNWSVLFLQAIIFVGTVLIAPAREVELLLLFYLVMIFVWLYVRWCLIRQSLESDLLPTVGVLILLFLASQLVGSAIGDIGNAVYTRFFDAGEMYIEVLIDAEPEGLTDR